MTIRTEDGRQTYRFDEASRFTWGIWDAAGEKLLSLYQEWDRAGLKPLRPCHGTLGERKFTAELACPIPLMISLDDLGWKAEGDLPGWRYTLTKHRQQAAVLRRHWLLPGDYYTLEVPDPADTQVALAVALCVHLMRKRK